MGSSKLTFLNYASLIISCDNNNQNHIYFDSYSNNYCHLQASNALDCHKRLDLNTLINLGEVVKKQQELPSDVLANLKNRASEMGVRHDHKLQEKFGIFSNVILCKERFVNWFKGAGFCTIRERTSKIFQDIIACPPAASQEAAPAIAEESHADFQPRDKEVNDQKEQNFLKRSSFLRQETFFPTKYFLINQLLLIKKKCMLIH